MTPKERLALGSLLAVMVAGHAVRIFALGPDQAPGGLRLVAGLAPADPLAHRDRSLRLGRPVGAAERLDLNRASAEDLARLPRVGMAVAKAIVRDRERSGPFGSVDDLDRVPGVGAGLLALVASHLSVGDTGRVGRKHRTGRAVWPAAPLPPLVVDSARGRRVRPKATGSAVPVRRIPLNSASQADLERLPGIGPTRAKAILAYRQGHGPFASVSDLEKVPGLPRRLVAQLAAQVAVP